MRTFFVCLWLAASGCQRDGDVQIEKKLDEIGKRLEEIDRKLAGGTAARMPARPPGPDPKAVYAVPIEGSPFTGPAHAKVTLVEAYDFACPWCSRAQPVLAALQKEYGSQLKIVYKQLVVHPQVATTPALAACAAHLQGRFGEMYKLIWEKGFPTQKLGGADMEALAAELKLDPTRFRADMNGARCRERLDRDAAELAQLGVHGTPGFFVNGRVVPGFVPIETFRPLIDEELKKADDALKTGTRLEAYYDSILARGLKKL